VRKARTDDAMKLIALSVAILLVAQALPEAPVWVRDPVTGEAPVAPAPEEPSIPAADEQAPEQAASDPAPAEPQLLAEPKTRASEIIETQGLPGSNSDSEPGIDVDVASALELTAAVSSVNDRTRLNIAPGDYRGCWAIRAHAVTLRRVGAGAVRLFQEGCVDQAAMVISGDEAYLEGLDFVSGGLRVTGGGLTLRAIRFQDPALSLNADMPGNSIVLLDGVTLERADALNISGARRVTVRDGQLQPRFGSPALRAQVDETWVLSSRVEASSPALELARGGSLWINESHFQLTGACAARMGPRPVDSRYKRFEANASTLSGGQWLCGSGR
jgi:hypothetical protein